MYLAALGFLLSALAHCLAVANVSIPGGDMIFALHVGIFVVWIPTVLVSNSATRMVGRRDFWKVALAGCPAWMRWMLYTLLGYAVVNFVYCMAYLGMGRNHVMPMREAAPPSVVRMFSGHWMVFYFTAFAVLYSRTNAPELYRERRCAQGHKVSPLAKYCPECGEELGDA
jgi:hypothetical protein